MNRDAQSQAVTTICVRLAEQLPRTVLPRVLSEVDCSVLRTSIRDRRRLECVRDGKTALKGTWP